MFNWLLRFLDFDVKCRTSLKNMTQSKNNFTRHTSPTKKKTTTTTTTTTEKHPNKKKKKNNNKKGETIEALKIRASFLES